MFETPFRANLVEPKKWQGVEDSINSHLIRADFKNINFPLVFTHDEGYKLLDLIGTTWAGLYLISDRARDIFLENRFSGWTHYSIELYDEKGRAISGYCGLSVSGRCGPIDFSSAPTIQKRIGPTTPLTNYYVGLPIGLDQWDGSDFFLPSGSYHIIISKAVANAILKNKLKNIELECLAEIETPHYAVPKK